jgi:hypothetical protein
MIQFHGRLVCRIRQVPLYHINISNDSEDLVIQLIYIFTLAGLTRNTRIIPGKLLTRNIICKNDFKAELFS